MGDFVVFRTDAYENIGTGHLMRCITLARELMRTGNVLLFVIQKASAVMSPVLRRENIRFKIIDVEPDCTWEVDAQKTCECLNLEHRVPEWIVVDSYRLDHKWENVVRGKCKKIFVIDDLARSHHDCELLLNQNISSKDSYYGLLKSGTQILTGPQYALLMDVFSTVSYKREPSSRPRINIFLGGADILNDTEKAIRATLSLSIAVDVDVVFGRLNGNWSYICNKYSEYSWFNFYRDVSSLAELFRSADIGIGGGGTTTWERACVGLPSLIIEQAPNQRDNAIVCERLGIGWYVGESKIVNSNIILEKLEAILSDRSRLQIASSQAMQIVDGRGAQRVVEEMSRL